MDEAEYRMSMLWRFITVTTLQPYQYVVWDKQLKKVRAYGTNDNDTPCDIIGVYKPMGYTISEPPIIAAPNELVYIEERC
jgi:hypothetical protein